MLQQLLVYFWDLLFVSCFICYNFLWFWRLSFHLAYHFLCCTEAFFFFFLYISYVYSCHLFLISTVSVRSIIFLSFIKPIFAWTGPLVSLIFLKRSLVFPNLLFSLFICIDHWGKLSYLFLLFIWTLHSDAYIFAFLLCFLLLFFSQLFVRPHQTAILLFCNYFPWG